MTLYLIYNCEYLGFHNNDTVYVSDSSPKVIKSKWALSPDIEQDCLIL